MRPERADFGYVWDMLQAAQEVLAFVRDVNYDSYVEDLVLVRAVERSVQIIGEAANRVSADFRRRNPEIPWQKIADQ